MQADDDDLADEDDHDDLDYDWDEETHAVSEDGEPVWLTDKPPPSCAQLSEAQKRGIREVAAYWEQRRGTMHGRTWKQQIQDKIKETAASVNVSRGVQELTDRLLVLLLQGDLRRQVWPVAGQRTNRVCVPPR